MLSVNLIVTGSHTGKESYFREACAEYEKRLSAFCRLTATELPDDKTSTARQLASLRPRAYKIALCVEGRQYSSEEFARLTEVASSSRGMIDLVIGGSEGLDESVKAACDLRLSFSKMTFPHRLMRVILLEQLYRAFTINAGKAYHK